MTNNEYELLPGYLKLIEQCPFGPSEFVDLAEFDSRMAGYVNGKPLIRNAEARKEYEMRSWALRIAAQALFNKGMQNND